MAGIETRGADREERLLGELFDDGWRGAPQVLAAVPCLGDRVAEDRLADALDQAARAHGCRLALTDPATLALVGDEVRVAGPATRRGMRLLRHALNMGMRVTRADAADGGEALL